MLLIILLGLLIVGYKVVFAPQSEDLSTDENAAAIEGIDRIYQQIESIDFSISSIGSEIQDFKSIETPLISLPVGKADPFSN